MILTLASEQDLTAEFRCVLSEVFRLHGWTDADELWLVNEPGEVDLALGTCKDFNARVQAVSVVETMGTAGGKTKLSWAVRQLLKPYQPPKYNWRHASLSDLFEVRDELVALDIEVSGDIRVDEPEDTELLSVAMAWKRHGDETIQGLVLGKEALQTRVARDGLLQVVGNNRLLTHNGKFDLRWINALLGTNVKPTHDTMLLHHSMFPGAAEHGLKPLARRILGAPDWESGAKAYLKGSKAHYERIPQDLLTEYNAWDVFWTFCLYEELDRLCPEDARRVYEHELAAGEMLQDVEAHGMGVDLEYADKLDDFYASARENALAGVQGFVENPNSVTQVKAAVKKHFGISLGGTSEQALKKALSLGKPGYQEFVTNLLELRGATKARSTYITSILNKVRGGRVHPTFLVHGTTTGRLSSSGPNVQNVTNDGKGGMSVRRMYVAPKGYTLVGADYAQAELRVMAELSGDEKMIADLQEDSPDFFDNILPSIFPDVDFTGTDKAFRHPYRLRGKRSIYGTSYGLTCMSISEMLTLDGHPTSIQEAAQIQDNYLGHYPGLQEWRNNTLPLVLAGDDLTTPFGRRFQQDVIVNDRKALSRVQNQSWAFRPQSVASDICVRAAVNLWQEFADTHKYKDCHIIALVHDAIYPEVPEELGEEVRLLTEKHMRESGAMTYSRVPLLTDSHAARTWDQC